MTEPTEPTNTTEQPDQTDQSWSNRAMVGAVLLILLGCSVRVGMFVSDRGLWLDEAMQATSIVNRTIPELLEPPLEFNQIGTPPFLIAERLMVQTFGPSEKSLRTVPLIAGCLSLVFFLLAARHCLSPSAALLALALFALSEPIAYYASEVKDYSCAMLATCVIAWSALRVLARSFAVRELVIFTVLASLMVWFSVSIVFVAAGMFGVLVLASWMQGDRKAAVLTCVCGAVTAGSFGVLFKLFVQPTTSAYFDSAMAQFYVALGGYMPMPPTNLADLEWFVTTPFEFFVDPMGLPTFGLMVLAACVGAAVLWQRHRSALFLLAAPFGLALVASAIRQYPFITRGHYDMLLMGRNILFLTPLAFLLIGGGVHRLATSLESTARWLPTAAVLIALLFPTFYTVKQIKDPARGSQDIRPGLQHIKDHWQDGDAIYLGWMANKMFAYYGPRFEMERSLLLNNDPLSPPAPDADTPADPETIPTFFSSPEIFVRLTDWKAMEQILFTHIEKRKPKRIWVLFAYHNDSYGYAEAKFVTHQLSKRGEVEKVQASRHAGLFLVTLEPAEDGP